MSSSPPSPSIIRSSTFLTTPLRVHSPQHLHCSTLRTYFVTTDFIDIYHLSILFSLTSDNFDSILSKVNYECLRFHHVIYNNDDSGPINNFIGPTCIFQSESSHARQLLIFIDSDASKGLSPLRDSFTTFKTTKQQITGISSHSNKQGIGVVRWKIIDQNGMPATIETEF